MAYIKSEYCGGFGSWGEEVTALRESQKGKVLPKGMTKKEFADLVGVSANCVSNWESSLDHRKHVPYKKNRKLIREMCKR